VHWDEWHPFSSPPLVGGVRGGGKWERILTPTFVLPHPRHNSGIFDKGEEIVFKEIGKPRPVGGIIHSGPLPGARCNGLVFVGAVCGMRLDAVMACCEVIFLIWRV